MEKWSLSPFDKFCLGMNIKGAWIYDELPDAGAMKASLKTLLALYPFLLGHYEEKEKAILYDANQPDDCIIDEVFSELSHKEVTMQQLISLAGSGVRRSGRLWSLAPKYDIKGFKDGKVRPFSASLVTLKDGAMLVVSCAHAAMDGHSFYSLVRQWAELCRGGEVSAMKVNQSVLPDPHALSREAAMQAVVEAGWQTVSGKKLIKMLWNLIRTNSVRETYCIEVSQSEIHALKEKTGAGANAVLSAMAAKALFARLKGKEKFKYISVADLRNHFPGVEENFFGNFSQATPCSSEFDTGSSVEALASQIDSNLKGVLSSNVPECNVRLSFCATSYGLPYFYFDSSDMNNSNPGTIYVNNQLKFRPAEIDWGKGCARFTFENDLTDMVKLWQPVAGGPVQIIFGGLAARIMARKP